jgi:hypothetical protein
VSAASGGQFAQPSKASASVSRSARLVAARQSPATARARNSSYSPLSQQIGQPPGGFPVPGVGQPTQPAHVPGLGQQLGQPGRAVPVADVSAGAQPVQVAADGQRDRTAARRRPSDMQRRFGGAFCSGSRVGIQMSAALGMPGSADRSVRLSNDSYQSATGRKTWASDVRACSHLSRR